MSVDFYICHEEWSEKMIGIITAFWLLSSYFSKLLASSITSLLMQKFDSKLTSISCDNRQFFFLENRPFHQTLLQYMSKECNKVARMLRENIEEQGLETNLKFYRRCATKVDSAVANSAAKEIVRKVDARLSEHKYVKEKIGYNVNCIDVDARNAFLANKISPSIIKCTNDFNSHRIRDRMNNKIC